MPEKTQRAAKTDMLENVTAQKLRDAFELTGSSAHYLGRQPWEMMPDVAQIRNADMSLNFLGAARMRTGAHALGSTVPRETKPRNKTEHFPSAYQTPPTPTLRSHALHRFAHEDMAQARTTGGATLLAHLRRHVPGWSALHDSATADGDKTVPIQRNDETPEDRARKIRRVTCIGHLATLLLGNRHRTPHEKRYVVPRPCE